MKTMKPRRAPAVHLLPGAQTTHWSCYASDADARIYVVAESSALAIAIAARHFGCTQDEIICRYAMTLVAADVNDRRYRWPIIFPPTTIVHGGGSRNPFA
jgi:hypothetical protein